MTDKEIIKALECCISDENCENCPLHHKKIENACTLTVVEFYKEILDLINRQQAEIERLQNEIGSLNKKYPCTVQLGEHCLMYARSLDDYDKQIGDISTEAIKGFAERLKEQAKANEWNGTICGLDIDRLEKEMVGEDK